MQHLKHKSKHGQVLAVSMMKDEAPFLLEWVAHHLAIGFTDLLVYTNDCTDGTDDMLIRLQELGLAHHRRNVIAKGQKPQPSAIRHAQLDPVVQNADWVLLFDADEFLALSHPAGHLEGLLDDTVARGANGVVITWRIFGSSGIIDWSPAPVTEQYLRAAPPLWNKGWGVKTLFKFDPTYWKLGIHRPAIKNKWLETDFPDSVHWLNGSGHPMEDYFKFRGWRSIRRTLGYDWAQMNHYAVKSIDAYAVRKLRGNVNNKVDKYNADYWALQDRNEIEDRTILRHAADRARIMDALLQDPKLARLHEAALAGVAQRLAAYRETDAYRSLRDGLIAASQTPIAQVEAKPPKARDPAKIAALMSRVEKRAHDTAPQAVGWAATGGDPYLPAPLDLSADIALTWADNHGIALPADPRLFVPEMLDVVLAGRFDRRHARNIAGYLDGCKRMLELGGGIGFIARRALACNADLAVIVQDSRTDLLAYGRDLAGDAPGIDWTPSDISTALSDVKPDLLRLARPEALSVAQLNKLDLTGITRVLLPFATQDQAATLRDTLGATLVAHGFAEAPGRDAAGSLQFDRPDRRGLARGRALA